MCCSTLSLPSRNWVAPKEDAGQAKPSQSQAKPGRRCPMAESCSDAVKQEITCLEFICNLMPTTTTATTTSVCSICGASPNCTTMANTLRCTFGPRARNGTCREACCIESSCLLPSALTVHSAFFCLQSTVHANNSNFTLFASLVNFTDFCASAYCKLWLSELVNALFIVGLQYKAFVYWEKYNKMISWA